MQYWLIKSEPYVFSYQQLEKDGKGTWDGVRNYQARNNLRTMKIGDLCLFYHSNEGLAVVGIASVTREHFPDVTAEKGDWSAVEIAPFRSLDQHIPLSLIKNTPTLQHTALVKNARLSVMAFSKADFDEILGLGGVML
jgi:predicted RNA-binding protein with PUA-like domain